MPLLDQDLQRIAHLARLAIRVDDIEPFRISLNTILELVSHLQAVDTQGVEPMAHPFDAVQRLRADEISETNHRDEYQKIAPAIKDGLFLVPKVID
jgi:aspartyl-tRNA(Asn)/glutamyl-tRNA(Gln) amidotransferase subunit C